MKTPIIRLKEKFSKQIFKNLRIKKKCQNSIAHKGTISFQSEVCDSVDVIAKRNIVYFLGLRRVPKVTLLISLTNQNF